MSKSELIKIEANGLIGTAEVKWIPDNQYSVAHYGAFITVPYQPSSWVHLFIHDRADLNRAIEKAKEYLQNALERCTLC